MELKHLRILVQILNCLMGFGGYFLLDLPGSVGTGAEGTIEQRFEMHNKTYTQSMNLGLYSAYSWPSIATVFSGVLIDQLFGRRRSTLLFSGLTFLGALLFWLGIISTNYGLLVFSRIILGFGSESVTVVQSAYVTRWFKDQRLGLSIAQSISVAFLRLGTASNFLMSPGVGESSGVSMAGFLGVVFAAMSLLSAIGIVILDRRAAVSGALPEYDEDGTIKTPDNVGNDDLPDTIESNSGAVATLQPVAKREESLCEKIKSIPLSMWIVVLVAFFVYTGMFPLISITENFFQVKYGMSHTAAGRPTSVYEILSAIGLLFSGFAVDFLGRHTIWLTTSLALLVIIHLLFLVTSVTPYLPMIILAFSYCFMVSALWTVPPFIVRESLIGMSYGTLTAALNFGLAVFPLAVGSVLDDHTPKKKTANEESTPLPNMDGYNIAVAMLLIMGAFGLFACVWLIIVDKRSSGILGASPDQREQMKHRLADISQPLTPENEGMMKGSNDSSSSAAGGMNLNNANGDVGSSQELKSVNVFQEQSDDLYADQ